MLAVIDVNIVFSALLRKGNSFEVFESNKALSAFEFFSPDFVFLELGRRVDKLLSKSEFSKEEFSKVFSFIKGELNTVSTSEYAGKLPEAKELNQKDAPYLALALKLNCPIISGDKGLRGQYRVRVLSPAEALSVIYGSALPGLSFAREP